MNGMSLSTWFLETGSSVVEWVLAIAEWLTGEGTPGWVSLVLLALLVLAILVYGAVTVRFVRAVRAAGSVVGDESARMTGSRFLEVDRGLQRLGNRSIDRRLVEAWSEFKETAVAPQTDSDVLRNTVRPSAFFNREDLRAEAPFWRRVPALFVSVGLFLTFLGLVAALDQTGRVLDAASDASTGGTADSLKTLLQVASAKFIMSLTGLFCSIIFTVTLSTCARPMDSALYELCHAIEDGCDYLSEQGLLREMLDQSREQTTQLQTFSTELVAQIARPLREDLPQAIREGIREVMEPAMNSMSRDAGKGIESMAGAVSDRLAEGIQASVAGINEAIGKAAEQVGAVADRLDQSSNAMSGQVETTLQSIKSASDDSAEGIAKASQAMVQAAQDLSETINESLTASARAGGGEIERAGREVASGVDKAAADLRTSLLDPLRELLGRLEALGQGVDSATGQVGRYSASVEASARAVDEANERLGKSATTLAGATQPVRDAVAGIETASRTMGERVAAASMALVTGAAKTSREMTEMISVLSNGIRESQATLNGGLASVNLAIGQFKDIVARFREIDQGLGDAFEKIDQAVEGSIKEIREFERAVNDEFGNALTRLQGVIATIEPFQPRGAE